MEKNLLLPLLLVCCVQAGAQLNEADSIKERIRTEKNDTARIRQHCNLADYYLYSKPDSALKYSYAGLEIANQMDFSKGKTWCLTRIGNIFKAVGEFPNALQHHLASLEISEKIEDRTGIGASYNNIAEVYKEQKDYRHSIEYYIKTENIFNAIVDDLLQPARPLAPSDSSRLFLHRLYLELAFMNRGDTYERMSILDSALQYQQKAYSMALAIGDEDYIGAILTNMGIIYTRQGSYDLALDCFKKSIPYLSAVNDEQFLSITYKGLSELYEKKERPDSALYYARHSLRLAMAGSFTTEIQGISMVLTRLFEAKKMPDSAFFYQKLVSAVTDSMFAQEKIRKVEALTYSEKQRQQDILVARAKAEERRKHNLQYFAISIFLVAFFVALLLMKKRKKKARFIQYLGLIGALLLFEFIALFLHPYIGNLTHHAPIFMLIILAGVAAILTPLHHKLSHWAKQKLPAKNEPVAKPGEETKKPLS